MRACNCCGEMLPEEKFSKGNRYVNRKGETVYYRRKTCKRCYAGYYRNKGRENKRDKINRLISWSAPVLLAIVVGTYQYDSVSGSLRTCTYASVHGHHSVTIDSMNMCPLTWEFEV